jgi:hypothetical protein
MPDRYGEVMSAAIMSMAGNEDPIHVHIRIRRRLQTSVCMAPHPLAAAQDIAYNSPQTPMYLV